MAVKADPFLQRKLIDLAGLDKALAGAMHRRRSLPELAAITELSTRVATLRDTVVVAQTEVSDLDRAARKAEQEIDQVRTRARRDADRLASGAGNARDMENLQHEIQSLARRQGVLEDDALELMERRETAEAALRTATEELAAAQQELTAAQTRRDDAFADIDDQCGRLRAERTALVGGLPADLVALYERIHASGKVAAAMLNGARCEACRIDLDRVALSTIHTTGVDTVVRCDECGAILIRA